MSEQSLKSSPRNPLFGSRATASNAGLHLSLAALLIFAAAELSFAEQLGAELLSTTIASSTLSKIFIGYGLALVLLSAVIVLMGPLVLRWGTQKKAENTEQSLVALIYRRNRRSRWYHIAAVVLVLGLTGYVGSVICYLFQL